MEFTNLESTKLADAEETPKSYWQLLLGDWLYNALWGETMPSEKSSAMSFNPWWLTFKIFLFAVFATAGVFYSSGIIGMAVSVVAYLLAVLFMVTYM